MSKKQEKAQEYSNLRIKAETARKLKVLSGLKDKSQLDVVEELVDKAYITAVSLAAKGLEK